ncbi:putative quinol monooxygenase [Staphylococcus pasteuri]|uniref:putative quinol monooxygenase n=1 Tax=Staphylococcus pasteuri TaxID=45972 RepID=UPI000E689973|nr:antibiotic biosynthesis monooxygenase [Staphylococcus pasteuri]MCT1926670.1 antibiotic biosynthesis monooxygenase [Staphylococcus pasteuri]QQT10453.1 antibiotic biosynthesis monooxygenase [Staphylococcus pasteuri]RIO53949.1 antibiotic biosynthesis monooxygenase [Staphylococcus pasteuri]
MTKPIVHLFKLGIEESNRHIFHQAGVHNLTTSYKNEVGTLAMYSSRLKSNLGEYLVLEIYEDTEAYQTHVNSNQYKYFIDHVGNHLIKQVKYEVEPLFLKEKLSSQQCVEPNQYLLKFAQIEIEEDQQNTFENSVLTNMEASMSEEEDVLAMYALRDVNQHNKYYFYEVYQNEQAYEAHCETEHFKKYIQQTKDILNDKKLYNLENDVFITQGNLRFK